MTKRNIAFSVEQFFSKNSPSILTAGGITGTFVTAYLAAKAAYTSAEVIHRAERFADPVEDKREVFKNRAKLVWKLYIPAGVSATATVSCIIGASKIHGRRTAVAAATYAITERAFSEYKEKVVEQFGERKEQGVRDAIAKEKLEKNNPKEILIVGAGEVLCCELHTGRYFMSDMESLRKAQNDLNAKLISNDEATLSDLYYLIGLPYTTYSSNVGWTSDRLLELSFTTVMSDDNRPCVAFDYNYVRPL